MVDASTIVGLVIVGVVGEKGLRWSLVVVPCMQVIRLHPESALTEHAQHNIELTDIEGRHFGDVFVRRVSSNCRPPKIAQVRCCSVLVADACQAGFDIS